MEEEENYSCHLNILLCTIVSMSPHPGSFPMCQLSPAQSGNVCAYKFVGPKGEICTGREYDLISYANDTAAEADGAVVMHRNGSKSQRKAKNLGYVLDY